MHPAASKRDNLPGDCQNRYARDVANKRFPALFFGTRNQFPSKLHRYDTFLSLHH